MIIPLNIIKKSVTQALSLFLNYLSQLSSSIEIPHAVLPNPSQAKVRHFVSRAHEILSLHFDALTSSSMAVEAL